MVDSLKYSNSVSSLPRTPIATANAGQFAARTLIDAQANGAKPSTVQPAVKGAKSPKGDLPRGSLVDILA